MCAVEYTLEAPQGDGDTRQRKLEEFIADSIPEDVMETRRSVRKDLYVARARAIRLSSTITQA